MNNARRLNRNAMTGRILLLIASIADENGEFAIKDAVNLINEEFPQMRNLYATPICLQVGQLADRGLTERTGVWGLHRLLFSTLDMMEASGFSLQRIGVSV